MDKSQMIKVLINLQILTDQILKTDHFAITGTQGPVCNAQKSKGIIGVYTLIKNKSTDHACFSRILKRSNISIYCITYFT